MWVKDSLIAQSVKKLPAMQETHIRFLGREDPLEKGMATHFSILAWRILKWVAMPFSRGWQPTSVFLPGESHGQRRLVGYGPWGHKKSEPTEAT